MQHKTRSLVVAIMMASLLAAPLAEARRTGGGKSYGMARTQSSSQSYSRQNQNSYANNNYTQQQTAKQSNRSNVGKMVAAGVAGAAIGAVAANAMADNHNNTTQTATAAQQPENNWQSGQNTTQQTQPEKSHFSWFWLIILAAGAFFLYRKFAGKKKEQVANPYTPNNTGGANLGNSAPSPFDAPPPAPNNAGNNTNIFGQSVGGNQPTPNYGAYTNSGNQLPDGSEPATFLRFARQRFNHIQSMNNASNIHEVEKYFTADMYRAIYQEIQNNQDVAEFSNLTANVVDQATENNQYVVSVRFAGMVSEDLNSPAVPFTEVWHFVKPINSTQDWLVAGIQQDQ